MAKDRSVVPTPDGGRMRDIRTDPGGNVDTHLQQLLAAGDPQETYNYIMASGGMTEQRRAALKDREAYPTNIAPKWLHLMESYADRIKGNGAQLDNFTNNLIEREGLKGRRVTNLVGLRDLVRAGGGAESASVEQKRVAEEDALTNISERGGAIPLVPDWLEEGATRVGREAGLGLSRGVGNLAAFAVSLPQDMAGKATDIPFSPSKKEAEQFRRGMRFFGGKEARDPNAGYSSFGSMMEQWPALLTGSVAARTAMGGAVLPARLQHALAGGIMAGTQTLVNAESQVQNMIAQGVDEQQARILMARQGLSEVAITAAFGAAGLGGLEDEIAVISGLVAKGAHKQALGHLKRYTIGYVPEAFEEVLNNLVAYSLEREQLDGVPFFQSFGEDLSDTDKLLETLLTTGFLTGPATAMGIRRDKRAARQNLAGKEFSKELMQQIRTRAGEIMAGDPTAELENAMAQAQEDVQAAPTGGEILAQGDLNEAARAEDAPVEEAPVEDGVAPDVLVDKPMGAKGQTGTEELITDEQVGAELDAITQAIEENPQIPDNATVTRGKYGIHLSIPSQDGSTNTAIFRPTALREMAALMESGDPASVWNSADKAGGLRRNINQQHSEKNTVTLDNWTGMTGQERADILQKNNLVSEGKMGFVQMESGDVIAARPEALISLAQGRVTKAIDEEINHRIVSGNLTDKETTVIAAALDRAQKVGLIRGNTAFSSMDAPTRVNDAGFVEGAYELYKLLTGENSSKAYKALAGKEVASGTLVQRVIARLQRLFANYGVGMREFNVRGVRQVVGNLATGRTAQNPQRADVKTTRFSDEKVTKSRREAVALDADKVVSAQARQDKTTTRENELKEAKADRKKRQEESDARREKREAKAAVRAKVSADAKVERTTSKRKTQTTQEKIDAQVDTVDGMIDKLDERVDEARIEAADYRVAVAEAVRDGEADMAKAYRAVIAKINSGITEIGAVRRSLARIRTRVRKGKAKSSQALAEFNTRLDQGIAKYLQNVANDVLNAKLPKATVSAAKKRFASVKRAGAAQATKATKKAVAINEAGTKKDQEAEAKRKSEAAAEVQAAKEQAEQTAKEKAREEADKAAAREKADRGKKAKATAREEAKAARSRRKKIADEAYAKSRDIAAEITAREDAAAGAEGAREALAMLKGTMRMPKKRWRGGEWDEWTEDTISGGLKAFLANKRANTTGKTSGYVMPDEAVGLLRDAGVGFQGTTASEFWVFMENAYQTVPRKVAPLTRREAADVAADVDTNGVDLDDAIQNKLRPDDDVDADEAADEAADDAADDAADGDGDAEFAFLQAAYEADEARKKAGAPQDNPEDGTGPYRPGPDEDDAGFFSLGPQEPMDSAEGLIYDLKNEADNVGRNIENLSRRALTEVARRLQRHVDASTSGYDKDVTKAQVGDPKEAARLVKQNGKDVGSFLKRLEKMTMAGVLPTATEHLAVRVFMDAQGQMMQDSAGLGKMAALVNRSKLFKRLALLDRAIGTAIASRLGQLQDRIDSPQARRQMFFSIMAAPKDPVMRQVEALFEKANVLQTNGDMKKANELRARAEKMMQEASDGEVARVAKDLKSLGLDITNEDVMSDLFLMDPDDPNFGFFNVMRDMLVAKEGWKLGELMHAMAIQNLFSLATTVVNITSNSLMMAALGFERGVEGLMNSTLEALGKKDVHGPRAGDFSPVIKAAVKGLLPALGDAAKAFATGYSPTDLRMGQFHQKSIQEQLGSHASVFFGGGLKSRILSMVATPLPRSISLVDEFFKSLMCRAAITGVALDTARQEGLKMGTSAFDDRVASLVVSPSRAIQAKALTFANEATFKEKLDDQSWSKAVERWVGQVRNAAVLDDTPFALRPGVLIIPFLSSLIRIGRQAGRRAVGLQEIAMIKDMVNAYKSEGSLKAALSGGKAQSYRNLTGYILAMAALALKGDDGEDLIQGGTGSSSYFTAEQRLDNLRGKAQTVGGVDITRFDPLSISVVHAANMRDAFFGTNFEEGRSAGDRAWRLIGKTGSMFLGNRYFDGLRESLIPMAFGQERGFTATADTFKTMTTMFGGTRRQFERDYKGEGAKRKGTDEPNIGPLGGRRDRQGKSLLRFIAGTMGLRTRGEADPEKAAFLEALVSLQLVANKADAAYRDKFMGRPRDKYTDPITKEDIELTDKEYTAMLDDVGAETLATLRAFGGPDKLKAVDNPQTAVMIMDMLEKFRAEAVQLAKLRVSANRARPAKEAEASAK